MRKSKLIGSPCCLHPALLSFNVTLAALPWVGKLLAPAFTSRAEPGERELCRESAVLFRFPIHPVMQINKK